MPRIPENEIERLMDEVSVQWLAETSGVELKKAGKDWLGRCRFHDDRGSLLGGESGEEPVALLRLPDRRRSH